MRVKRWSKDRSRTLEISDWIMVDDEIETHVIIELDYSPAEPDINVPESSFAVIDVRYHDCGTPVEARFVTNDMIATWEDCAPELVAEYEDEVRDVAAEAKADARREGD